VKRVNESRKTGEVFSQYPWCQTIPADRDMVLRSAIYLHLPNN